MRKRMFLFILSVAWTVSFLFAENYEEKISKRFVLPSGGAVELANVNGEIDVTTTGGDAVEIKAVKKSDRKGEIETVDVLFDSDGGVLRVKTKYNRRNANVRVDFTVSVPEKLARAEFRSVNGRIGCAGRFAELVSKTVNGKVKLNGEFRSADFKTVNGSIAVSQESLLGGDLNAATVNGAIEIEFNRKSAFEIEGRTVNGSIANDFGVAVQRKLVGSSLSGVVNGGGRKVKVETVNGSIEISKI